MAEAHNTLPGNRRTNHLLRLERKQIAMTATMARYLARKRVKDHLRANGVRLWEIEPADLQKAANAYWNAGEPS